MSLISGSHARVLAPAMIFILLAEGAGGRPAVTPRFEHVVVIVLENHEFSEVIGSTAAPYLNALAQSKALLTHSYAVAHPSLPNYLAMIGGSTFGVTTDSTPPLTGKTLVDQLENAGITWKGYMQTMPSACFLDTNYGTFPYKYVGRHDPFINFARVRHTPAWCDRVVPYTDLAIDLSAGRLPQFAWITPNICNDMHSCSVTVGDAWLAAHVPAILSALGKTGILILTFDEGSTSSGCCGGVARGGRIPTVIAGPGAAEGIRVTADVDGYSLLRMIEHSFGLSYLRHAATAPAIRGFACPAPPCS